ncbi:DUF1349 domain-containing protein [Paenibacillus sp. FSL K6-3166]|uniref:DUF1349 domain-containing protein n=1 Tax=unclassified Paenibacillus TaxID=185978 RepID=UPI000BA14F12|nr:DUF1349 domain-containing protein [Paenibacillus sp. VTT E-133291]OZQ97940.1 hypothetical protein CA598_02920 [Paenibacillus sp. VTT E-133291]
MNFIKENLFWQHPTSTSSITDNKIEIVTEPNTDFWQRTYYGFRNDNAPALLMKTDEKYFSFIVKTDFDSAHRFDQCGVIVYQDSDNWFKASIEYENEEYQRLGSVVTNHGYSDWATTDIDATIKTMYYRLSRRESDFCVENSLDGITFKQMRIFHLFEGSKYINFGLYACSPEDSSFKATFTEIEITECQWLEHK